MIRTSEQVAAEEELLRHDGWTRRLARSLVSDDALADDVAQDTWVAALRRPPETQAPLRPWLRKVVRHTLFNQSRLGRRRDARERASGLPPDPLSPEELVGRGEIHRLGGGVRLFDVLANGVRLEKLSVDDGPLATHLATGC